MASPINLIDSAHPRRRGLFSSRIVWGCLAAPTVLAVVLAVAVLSWWVVESRRAAQELAVEIAKVRSRGEPLTTEELDDYYVAAPDRPDMTSELLCALALCESPDLVQMAKDLPLVGAGPEIPDPPETWDQLAAVEAYLARHQSALDVFHEVARQEGTARYPVDLSVTMAIRLKHVQTMRHAIRLLSLECQTHLHRGRPEAAVESMLAQLAILRTLENEPVMVTQLVRVAGHSVAVGNLALLLRVAKVCDEDMARVQRKLRRIDLEQSLRVAFVGERAMGYMACANPDVMNTKYVHASPEQARQVAQRPPQRLFDAAMTLRCNTRVMEASEIGLLEAKRVIVDVEAELKRLSKTKPKCFWYIVTLFSFPGNEAGVDGFVRSAAHRDTADAALAAELYRRRNGDWPPDLAALVPEFLPAVPLDPFTNEPLRFVSTPSEFKVYSVGKNLKDDGGNFSKDEPDVGFAIPLRLAESL